MALWQGYSDEAGYRDVADDDGNEYIQKLSRNDVKPEEKPRIICGQPEKDTN